MKVDMRHRRFDLPCQHPVCRRRVWTGAILVGGVLVAIAIPPMGLDEIDTRIQPVSLMETAQADTHVVAPQIDEMAASALNALPDTAEIPMPDGYDPDWQLVSLDAGRVNLQVLAHPFTVGDTEAGLGAEVYFYEAYLFEQMAHAMPEMAAPLSDLSLHAQALAYRLRQAARLQYEGLPANDMSHLQVRSSLAAQLQPVSGSPLDKIDRDQHGRVLDAVHVDAVAGTQRAAFEAQVDELLTHPAADQYPQAMRFLRHETERLKQLGDHLTLRWENEYYCPAGAHAASDCRPVNMRIHAVQTAREDKVLVSFELS